MIIKATIDGEELEFEVVPKDDSGGIFGGCAKATHHLTDKGIMPLTIGTTYYIATLRLIRKRHTFGGVVFEERETRQHVELGEWFMPTDWYHIQHYADSKRRTSYGTSGFIILRPVALE